MQRLSIRARLILGFLIPIFLIVLEGFMAVSSNQEIQKQFIEVTEETMPTIQALTEMKVAGLHIVSSTNEFAFLITLSIYPDANEVQDKETELREYGILAYEQAFEDYRHLVATYLPEQQDILVQLEQAGKNLQEGSTELILLLEEETIDASAILEAKGRFEEQELIYLSVIGEALDGEAGELIERERLVKSTVATSLLTIRIFTLVAVVASVLASDVIFASITHPISLLKQATLEIKQGKTEIQVKVTSTDDFGQLAQSFNQMSATIQQRERELTELNQSLEKRVEERTSELQQEITERKQTERERDLFFQGSVAMLSIIGFDNKFKQINPAWQSNLGWSEEELLSKDYFELTHPDDLDATMSVRKALIESGEKVNEFENRYRCKDGSYLWFSWNGSLLPDQEMTFWVTRDITERKQAEGALHRYANEQTALYAASQNFIGQIGVDDILATACQLSVRDFGMRMAWVGLVIEDSFDVHPAYSYGVEEGYLEVIHVTWDDSPTGQGPTGTAIRTGEMVAANHIDTDPISAPWREAALQRNYRSSAALPLLYGEKTLGALTVHSIEPDYFSSERLQVLQSLANQAAMSLQRARLFEQVKHHATVLEQRVVERTEELTVTNEQLQQSEERLQEAQQLAQIGNWEWDLMREVWTWSDELYRIFGIAPGAFHPSAEAFEATIHPDDREDFLRQRTQMLEKEQSARIDHRIILPDGEVRHVQERTQLALDTRGQVSRVTGTVQDITERKKTEKVLAELTSNLSYRINKLDCLYGISRLAEQQNISLEEMMQGTVDLITLSWQYPAITCARIILGDDEYRTENFEKSVWKQACDITVHEKVGGSLEVYYREEEAKSGLGKFLEGERRQIKTIAERLGRFIERLKAEEVRHVLQQHEREQRVFAEALNDIVVSVTGTLDLDEVLNRILEHIDRVVPHDAAAIMLVEGTEFRVVGQQGTLASEETIQILKSIPVLIRETPIYQEMSETGQALIVDTDQHPAWLTAAGLETVHDNQKVIFALIGAPIIWRGQVLGFINLLSTIPGFFEPEHARRLQVFAGQAAAAIQNARVYGQAQEVAAAQERERIAHDLHDAVSQTLFSAKITAESLPRIFDKNPGKVKKIFDELVLMTSGALAEMRSLLVELRPQALIATDLGQLLDYLCEAFTGRTQIPVILNVPDSCILSPNTQIVFYRIAQEALGNIARHAHATRVEIDLQYSEKQVTLHVIDNGCGFDPQVMRGGHFGISIMHERTEKIGAELKINSTLEEGTEIFLVWESNED
jgi:PAS domain S-box-containing protein